jgi:adenine-specific DNA-methyltransferase
LLQPALAELQSLLACKYKKIQETLKTIFGSPFYSDSGFILYQVDMIGILGRLFHANFHVDLTHHYLSPLQYWEGI